MPISTDRHNKRLAAFQSYRHHQIQRSDPPDLCALSKGQIDSHDARGPNWGRACNIGRSSVSKGVSALFNGLAGLILSLLTWRLTGDVAAWAVLDFLPAAGVALWRLYLVFSRS